MSNVIRLGLTKSVVSADDCTAPPIYHLVHDLSETTQKLRGIVKALAALDPSVPGRGEACLKIADAAKSIHAAATSLVQTS
jgi:hypothetical protein